MKRKCIVERKLTRCCIVLIIMNSLLLIAGCVWVIKIGAHKNKVMQQELLSRTMLLATAIPVEEVNALSFSADDVTLPQFQRIRDQLCAFNKISGHCCIRTCALKDGKVVAGP